MPFVISPQPVVQLLGQDPEKGAAISFNSHFPQGFPRLTTLDYSQEIPAGKAGTFPPQTRRIARALDQAIQATLEPEVLYGSFMSSKPQLPQVVQVLPNIDASEDQKAGTILCNAGGHRETFRQGGALGPTVDLKPCR
jgi:hypothetical protein